MHYRCGRFLGKPSLLFPVFDILYRHTGRRPSNRPLDTLRYNRARCNRAAVFSCRARSRCHMQLEERRGAGPGYQAKLADLEAQIQAIAPDLQLPARHRSPNPIFARTELPRLTLAIMREEGRPLPVAVIVRRLLAAKGVTLPDRRGRGVEAYSGDR